MPALPLLDLPPRDVRVDDDVGVGSDDGRTRADDQCDPALDASYARAQRGNAFRGEEPLEAERAHAAEDGVIAKIRRKLAREILGREKRILGGDDR